MIDFEARGTPSALLRGCHDAPAAAAVFKIVCAQLRRWAYLDSASSTTPRFSALSKRPDDKCPMTGDSCPELFGEYPAAAMLCVVYERAGAAQAAGCRGLRLLPHSQDGSAQHHRA